MVHLLAIMQERAQALTEYAFLLVFVVLVVVLILIVFGDQVVALYNQIVTTLPS